MSKFINISNDKDFVILVNVEQIASIYIDDLGNVTYTLAHGEDHHISYKDKAAARAAVKKLQEL